MQTPQTVLWLLEEELSFHAITIQESCRNITCSGNPVCTLPPARKHLEHCEIVSLPIVGASVSKC